MSKVAIDHMGRVSVEGCVDLHLHSYPCYLAKRSGDDYQIASAAANAGMRGMVLKSHHESTVSRAYLVSSQFPSLGVFGGVTLNRYVGGINPAAAEAALQLGGKIVWMPTFDAAHHLQAMGSQPARWNPTGLSVLCDGTLTADALHVLEVIAEHDAVLATGHLSADEVAALVPAAREAGVRKILVNHPLYKGSNLPTALCEELVSMGAFIELQYAGITPIGEWEGQNLRITHSLMQRLGAEHCVVVSDAGQRFNPLPAESLRIFAQMLFELGTTSEELALMMINNPKNLLGIE